MKPHWPLPASLSLSAYAGRPSRCDPSYFTEIAVPGTQILDVSTTLQWQYLNDASYATGLDHPAQAKPIDFCNVTVSLTHPGWNDRVHIYVWLPLNDNWNGRYMSVGGGGLVAGGEGGLAEPVSMGYAAANTDGGHSVFVPFADLFNSEDWALTSPGNTNWYGINDFASRSIGDLPKVAKQVVGVFYGKGPKYSYWTGCSTGGRQGLMSAQRYAGDHDGILAAASAINWDVFWAAGIWPHVIMYEAGYFLPPCEFEVLRQGAIDACDELDGVRDGVISAEWLCNFTATELVGHKFRCGGRERYVSRTAAEVVDKIWKGPHDVHGRRIWYGLTRDTPTSAVLLGASIGTAKTECDAQQDHCHGVPFPLTTDVIRNWVMKDPDFDPETMDAEMFRHIVRKSRSEFASVIGTADPDLTEFKKAGGKMITWHGLADQIIPKNGTSSYYDLVEACDPDVRNYYRYFEAPGVFHCAGGPGPNPIGVFDALIKWVEQDKAPETLHATTVPWGSDNARLTRPLCLYPLVAAYIGGDKNEAASYRCAKAYDAYRRQDL